MEQKVVLIVDDDESLRSVLGELLKDAGYQVRTASTGAQALEMIAGDSFDAILLDIILPDVSGLDVLERYRGGGGKTPIIALSGLSTANDAVRAMRLGATDYLSKPFNSDELQSVLCRALGLPVPAEMTLIAPAPVEPSLINEPPILAEAGGIEVKSLIAVSQAMRRAKALVDRIADTDVPVLLLGESGVGKEVFAREIHVCSRRRTHPFIKVNCAALPGELLESELFGHERGAFTGATAEKPGKFELADKGTIFLDEIGEMDIRLQAKLLQVLQDEEFYRVGGRRR